MAVLLKYINTWIYEKFYVGFFCDTRRGLNDFWLFLASQDLTYKPRVDGVAIGKMLRRTATAQISAPQSIFPHVYKK